MSWLFLDWFVPLYLLVSVLVLAGFGACLYFLEPGLQDAHKWSNKTVRHHPLVASVNCRDDDSNALIWWRGRGGAGRAIWTGVLPGHQGEGGRGANTLKMETGKGRGRWGGVFVCVRGGWSDNPVPPSELFSDLYHTLRCRHQGKVRQEGVKDFRITPNAQGGEDYTLGWWRTCRPLEKSL